ncbi:hypothetical protein AcV7_003690 [Taiwanofungus camphoratus]|nr:hypothetical protein AcV7_003690 [Antrodia cinnamomea]
MKAFVISSRNKQPIHRPLPVAHLSIISQMVQLRSTPGRLGMRNLPHGSIRLSSGKQLPYASIAARSSPERAPPTAGVRAISDSSSLLHEPRPAHSLTLSRSPARRHPDLRLPPVPRCQLRDSSRLCLRTQRLAAPNPHAPAALKPEFSTARARDCRPQCPAGLARRLAAPRPCKPPFGRPDGQCGLRACLVGYRLAVPTAADGYQPALFGRRSAAWLAMDVLARTLQTRCSRHRDALWG